MSGVRTPRADTHPWKRGAARRKARSAAIARNVEKGKQARAVMTPCEPGCPAHICAQMQQQGLCGRYNSPKEPRYV